MAGPCRGKLHDSGSSIGAGAQLFDVGAVHKGGGAGVGGDLPHIVAGGPRESDGSANRDVGGGCNAIGGHHPADRLCACRGFEEGEIRLIVAGMGRRGYAYSETVMQGCGVGFFSVPIIDEICVWYVIDEICVMMRCFQGYFKEDGANLVLVNL
jgi:hypothetical protein